MLALFAGPTRLAAMTPLSPVNGHTIQRSRATTHRLAARLQSNRHPRPSVMARQALSAWPADGASRQAGARDRARGRPRHAARAADRLARETRGAVRRQIPHHRLRAVELRQLRHPPHRHLHAIQGAEPDPSRAARLELPRRPLQRIRRAPAGAAAHHRDWYKGTADAVYQNLDILRRHEPRVRAGPRRRPRLQDGLRADARRARRRAAPTSPIGCVEVPLADATRVRRDGASTTNPASSASRKSPSSRSRCPAATDAALAAWASTCSTRRSSTSS